ncbi:MAG: gliding motility-associated C-terminal domain-containing protein [Bacteroidales bacterium]|jgi:gliding motility-associated-like protein|nr:gliding motility-associated C-terminal domain-containing protein [Bacteroidales bacterium]
MKSFFILVLGLFLSVIALSQDVFVMPQNSSESYTTNNCIIYDDGGQNGVYGEYVNGEITINTTGGNAYYDTVYLEFDMEMPSFTKIQIYGSFGQLIFENSSAFDTLDIPVCDNSLRVVFHTDCDTSPHGYGFRMTVGIRDTCPAYVNYVNAQVLPNNQALLTWNAAQGNYLVSIGNSVFALQDTSMSFPYVVNGDTLFDLNHCENYSAYVYTPCDTASPYFHRCYESAYTQWRQCLCPRPTYINTNAINNTNDYLISWGEPTDTITWAIWLINDRTGDTIISTTDTNFFIVEDADINTHYTGYLYSDCSDASSHYAFSCGSSFGFFQCPVPLPAITSVYSTTDSIIVNWSNADSTINWVVSLSLQDSLIYKDTTTEGIIQYGNLLSETKYTLSIYGFIDSLICDTLVMDIVTYAHCISYSNLHSPTTKCTWGNTSSSPFDYEGVFDYGQDSVESRHTVITDTLASDPRTGDLLKLIPSGFKESVRLGNWEGGSSEAITYSYLVDTTIYSLLILRYAIVLFDPPSAHPADRRPSFVLEILDSNNIIVDTICGKANFVAGENTNGFNVYQTNILWKDWTTTGFDVSAYHKQKIKVRVTTRDCADGNPNHYGYAYFTLECSNKALVVLNCGQADSSLFAAPNGFAYQWYKDNVLISTSQYLTVPAMPSEYYDCVVSSIDNPSCNFTISAISGNRFPQARFSSIYNFRDCEFKFRFTDASFISSDSNGVIFLSNKCESVQWFVEDSLVGTDHILSYNFKNEGDYHIKLIAGIGNDYCLDSTDTIIHLVSPAIPPKISGDSVICDNFPATLTVTNGERYLWNTGQTTQSITHFLDTTTLYSVKVLDTYGCRDSAEYEVKVYPSYHNLDIYDTVCSFERYAPQGIPLTETGIYYLDFLSSNGCDSNIVLHLYIDDYCGDIFVPNAFTPDEQRNTRFIPYTDNAVEITFEVYNRYGGLVFISNNINEGWDGSFKGKPCPQGVYNWRLVYRFTEFPSLQQIKYGNVMLIR